MPDEEELAREAAATGFRPEALDKVLRLLELLEALRRHPFLKSRVALKGGTALNLFVLDAPRLSVDIDLNYIATADRAIMLAERPKVEQAVQMVCERLRIQIKRVPGEHAGGKWRLSYTSATGRPASMDLDMNFIIRTPLWPSAETDSKRIGSLQAKKVPMLDLHELAAGKLAALFARAAIRDIFDARELLGATAIDAEKLRLGFVVYGGMSRRDWRTLTVDEIRTDPARVDRELVPLLRDGVAPARKSLAAWTERLVSECRDRLGVVLPLQDREVEFLDRLNDQGRIVPELLTGDAALQWLIRAHPGLHWKAQNVRKHRGLPPTIE